MPSGVCTITSTTVPATPGGTVTLSDVDDTRLNGAGVSPNRTCRQPTRLVPVTVNVLAPLLGPLVLLRAVTVGVVEEPRVYVNVAEVVAELPAGVTTTTGTALTAA